MDNLAAVYDFVKEFTDIPEGNIIQGYNMRTALPQEQDFCILEMDELERVGTNVQSWTDEETTLHRLLRFTVICDFIGLDQQVQERRASVVETLGRSFEGAEFFKQYGMNLNYATTPQYLPYVYDANQYSHRYRVGLSFTQWQDVTLQRTTASKVSVDRMVNVDTYEEG